MPENQKGIESFIRPELAGFAGYAACKSPDAFSGRVVKLDANENNYGASPRVQAALSCFEGYHIYPDATQAELRCELAGYTDVPAENIVAGSGSDQLIDLLIRLFCAPGEDIINLPPTFAMFSFYAGLQGVRVVSVPRDECFRIDTAGIKKAITAATKLIFIANPNNPTGTLAPDEVIQEILALGLPTVVDEAYYEFTGKTFAHQIGKIPNLMVLRTFSKWAGLAGLRVGYGLFPVQVAEMLHAVRDPYNVNAAAVVAARESLKDAELLQDRVKLIVAERERLYGELACLGWLEPYPSQANFILCRVLRGEANVLQAALETRGILTRCFNSPGMENCIRLSVGRPEEDDILLEELRKL
ncbi:MAG: histidinol-phosphate transaminase [Dehalococcoidia bacterium]|nr:histidinol-phosphate transaminase [Dehalococcoidia bacterium]